MARIAAPNDARDIFTLLQDADVSQIATSASRAGRWMRQDPHAHPVSMNLKGHETTQPSLTSYNAVGEALASRMPHNAQRPASRSLRRSGQRTADRRCAAAGGGKGAMESAVLAYEAFQGGCPDGGVPHDTVSTWKAQPCSAYSGSVTHPVAPSDPAQRPDVPLAPSDPASGSRTGDALRRLGGRGLRRVLGSCSYTRRFRGGAQGSARPTDRAGT